ncbi:hypothetical protein ORI20_04530 [Mycobacterium sp. CVI_P3]|uniref:Lipoprotein n=1 Tax=Mycobacterium pinniadriaticum TaxID=2994102 RepID=A0ABT3S8X4_9MYCO|nr:hypothetical protein [Mycobacterium pinniadriaticum]MCX2929527.1 hypothetical protein [Mycobacterium pinniadriaticum]MCX2935951.1 hypothetical protein [Mycobacterium pinniadriaticum]
MTNVLTAAVLAVATSAVSIGVASADPTPTPAPAPAPDATPSPAPAPEATPPSAPDTTPPPSPAPDATPADGPKTVMDHDGTYKVGVDIVPGTYSTAGPIEGGACYWKRTGGPDGQTTVDNGLTKKPQVIPVDPGDVSFKTDGCQPWTLTDAAPPAAAGPLMSQLKLRHYLDTLNGMAGASGQGQLPPY